MTPGLHVGKIDSNGVPSSHMIQDLGPALIPVRQVVKLVRLEQAKQRSGVAVHLLVWRCVIKTKYLAHSLTPSEVPSRQV